MFLPEYLKKNPPMFEMEVQTDEKLKGERSAERGEVNRLSRTAGRNVLKGTKKKNGTLKVYKSNIRRGTRSGENPTSTN